MGQGGKAEQLFRNVIFQRQLTVTAFHKPRIQETDMSRTARSTFAAIAVACLAVVFLCGAVSGRNQAVRIIIETELGDIEAEIDVVRAPATAANFLKYVDGGFYADGRFHRTVKPDTQPNNAVKIKVIQASINRARSREGFPPIPLERTSVTGLSHKDGTLSMARSGPDTATSDFSICIGDQPSLDFGGARNPDGQGFAAFGRVIKGVDVVRKIQAAPASEQKLTMPIRIISIRRVS
jgi:peptidyl-prolyl cis-trans isomerase A (cyclophilin A)